MSTRTYSPGEAANRLGIPDRTLRFWSIRFADWLTPSAVAVSTGKGSRHRRYTEVDSAILGQIRQLAAQNVGLSAIEAALGARQAPAASQESSPPFAPAPAPSATGQLGAALVAADEPSPTPAETEASDVDRLAGGDNVPPPIGRATFIVETDPIDDDDDEEWLNDDGEQTPAKTSGHGSTALAWGARSDEAETADFRHDLVPTGSPPAQWSTASDVSDQLASIEARLATIESLLVDSAVKLADTAASSPAPRRRWWWPFGRRHAAATNAVGRRVARLAAERMLTRQELAARAGLPLATVQAILAGRQAPTPADLAALTAALGVAESTITGRS